ncbi:nicotinamidase/pyrazinamidase [Balnearium lithotrophicum]|uniref:nicotinamidase n=1 Tax=Balnearium lithotrophicum TaxID=223788 RepID=A0A521B0M2_9BACT|nr:nicotinamidase [Balnearium lithotrophicum]SMO40622.1 nicotinamidase/pyrazinamidase [Balnearium lithotrophicum]
MVSLTDRDALIVVDMQNDFMPWGSLPVPEADKIIPKVNKYIKLFFERGLPIFATRDWHPENHISFKVNGGKWPVHCVQWSRGADFAEGLEIPPETFIVNKGDRPELEAYSGFQGTVLNELLKERGIKRLFVCGVATEFCVKNTCIGGINLGYTVFLLNDAVKGIGEESSQRAVEELLRGGCIVLEKRDLILV